RRNVGGREAQAAEAGGAHHAGRVGRVAREVRAGGIDDVAVLVELELAVARVGHRAVDVEPEKTLAVDGEVERAVGDVDVALRERGGDARQRSAQADLRAAAAAQRGGIDVGEL